MDNQNNNTNPLLISYMTLRKAIGFLAISLPAILIIGTFTIGGCTHIEASISHYYFTVMGDVFVGFLISTGIFLISYKGYDLKDNIVSFLAGIFVLCIALFPTSKNEDAGCVIRSLSDVPLRIHAHYISAALFYLTLSYMSLFLFTKSSGNKTKQKIKRNRVYQVCGIMILVAILLIALENYIPGLNKGINGFHPTFWLEWVANFSYGVAWLIKGELLLKDKEEVAG
ncbi:MAG: hypothetical protein ACHQD8_05275 [Chitinophagales bacterium]